MRHKLYTTTIVRPSAEPEMINQRSNHTIAADVQRLSMLDNETHPPIGNGNGSPRVEDTPHNFDPKEVQNWEEGGKRPYRCPMCGREYPFEVDGNISLVEYGGVSEEWHKGKWCEKAGRVCQESWCDECYLNMGAGR